MNPLILVAIVAAFLVLAPILLVRFLPKGQEARRVEAVLRIMAPVVAVLPVFVGLLQYVSNQQAEAASAVRAEYIQATQLLMEKEQGKQLAGIAAVAQLAATNSERTWTMTDSLSTFVRFNAQREEPGTVLERGIHRHAPVPNPPCDTDAPEEFQYNYSTCGHPGALYISNPPVQAAIAALGSRNRSMENLSAPPARFKPLVASAGLLQREGGEAPRAQVVRYIEEVWSRQPKERRESNGQLIDEVQIGRGTEYPTIRPRAWLNLSHANLQGVEAPSAWLEGGNLRQSDLRFSNLAGAALAKATLADSWLVGSNLFHIDLRGADLEFADVRGSDLGQADLSKAWLAGATFSRANLWQAHLEGAYLIAADLTHLETASGANLDDIVAYRADFTDAKVSGDGIYGVCLRKAFLREATFTRAEIKGVDLTGSDLRDAQLSEAQLQGADLRDTRLDGAHLDKANLSRADLRGVDLSQTRGEPSSLNQAVVDGNTKLSSAWPQALVRSVSRTPVELSRECRAERTPAVRNALQSW